MSAAGYAPVNGLNLYYEVHGAGRPLVLLHGALSTIGTSFGRVLPSFAKHRQVIAVELQAHGHTADIDRPLSYEQMADDTAALVRELELEQADFFGYSMGGGVALQVAVRHPELVRKLVLASVAYRRDGAHPGAFDGAAAVTPEDLTGSPFEADYARTAPNPEDWATLVAKCGQLDAEFEGWSQDVVQSVAAPTLVMIGDSDMVRPEHAAHMFRLFGGGVFGDVDGLPASQLAVLPGTTHIGFADRGELLILMIEPFLDTDTEEHPA